MLEIARFGACAPRAGQVTWNVSYKSPGALYKFGDYLMFRSYMSEDYVVFAVSGTLCVWGQIPCYKWRPTWGPAESDEKVKTREVLEKFGLRSATVASPPRFRESAAVAESRELPRSASRRIVIFRLKWELQESERLFFGTSRRGA